MKLSASELTLKCIFVNLPASVKSSLYSRRWNPAAPSSVGPGIYLLHGLSEHSGRYEELGNWLAARGWRVGSHDHPGHGRSGGTRGRIKSSDSLARRAGECLAQFTDEIGAPVVLFGHSLGGALAAELVLQHGAEVAGIILSSPALAPAMSHKQQLQLRMMSRIAPDFTIRRPVAGERLSHDPQVVQAYRDDALVHGIVSARLIRWLVDSGKKSLSLAANIKVPTLMLVAGADQVVDASASREFAQTAPRDLLTLHWYDDYFHEVFNEDQARRAQVYRDLAGWLECITP